MDNRTRPVKIAALGMEKRTYSTLQLFFNDHCKDSYVLVEENSADISIIDMDGFQACRMLEEHKKQYPDQPSILISLSHDKAHDAVYIRKPIMLDALSSALLKAKERLQQPVTETPAAEEIVQKPEQQTTDKKPKAAAPLLLNNVTPPPQETVRRAKTGAKRFDQYRYSANFLTEDADLEHIDTRLAANFNPDNPLQAAEFQYQSEQTLQGYFQQAYFTALQKQQNVVLKGVWRPITILYKSKQLRVEKNFRHLYALSGMLFDKSEVSIELLDNDADCEPGLNETVLPAEPFLWKLAMRTSRGRVPMDTNFTAPIKLIRWPNFTRIIVTPHALRIAALWAKQPTSLMNTASYLAIPLQHVFMFYTAAVSLNFVAPAITEKDQTTATTPPVKRHRYRKIFQHLLARLRNN
ncbi:MAG TPA: response regulator [Gammaproteobacteria bacterium]|nr:response regulator [Gammaproteobacteria bacterium]